jgi:hypothetical protein
MRTLIIGSFAAKFIGVDLGREPQDIDAFTDVDNTSFDAFWHPALNEWLQKGVNRFATVNELYTIKMSHAYWDLHGTWLKHMNDLLKLKQAGGHVIQGFHDILYKIWIEKHGAKRVNLNMNAADFFGDAVTRLYEHDSIHDSVAYGDRPMYSYLLADGQEVAMDMNKVWALPFDDQIRLFREEIYATALERWMIPSGYKYSPRKAYADALKKTIISLTKGRSAQFIVDNYDIFKSPDHDYVRHHWNNRDKLIKLES